MRILIYSDLQATEGSDRCRHDPSLPLQRYRVKRCYDELVQLAATERCDRICDLGDTTDDRTFIYRATLDVLTDGLTRLVAGNHGFIKLTGNHEQLLKDGRIAAEGLYRPYFRNVGSGQVDVNGCIFVFRSYTDQYEALNAELAETADNLRRINPRERLILLAHGDVKGARYASGETCDEGISLATLDKFDIALLGHVHNHQCLLKGKAWFVGSPFQQDFGEAAQQKFVVVLDVSGEHGSVKFVQMDGFPEYRTVTLKDFLALANPKEEHRYRVILDSVEETERFYSHPLAELAEARLTYSEEATASSSEEVQLTDDPRRLLERYVAARPLTGLPELSSNDLVDLAMSFVGGD